MPRKIIVHLGLHKTATTSLQQFLQANNPRFLQHGARYIPLQRMRTDVTPLFWSFEKPKRAKLTTFLQGMEHQTVLLSDENIIGSPGELPQGGLYSYARNRIQTFCEDMKDTEITIFLTLREPPLFLTSMYSEYLRHNEFIPFEEFIAGYNVPAFSYWKTFGWLHKLPPNTSTRIIPFEIDRGGGVVRIAREIVEAACGPESGIDTATFPTQRSRSSYTTEEIELAADIARRAEPKMSQIFLNALDARDKRFGTTRFEPLPADLVTDLVERYDSDLQLFQSK
jgi:hypothetical protein